jgi:hypothetical protein
MAGVNSALLAVAVTLFVLAIGCYAVRPAAHMAPVGDMLIIAAFGVGTAVAARTALVAKERLRMLVYAAIWLAIAVCPWIVTLLRKDQSTIMGMLTMWAVIPAGVSLVKALKVR